MFKRIPFTPVLGWALGFGLCAWLGMPLMILAQETPVPVPTNDRSFTLEIQHAVDRGIHWLRENQNEAGWWSTPDQPAVTALAVMAVQGDPSREDSSAAQDWLKPALAYLVASRQSDGGLYRKGLVTYNTALTMLALLSVQDPSYESIIRDARSFLVGLQSDFNTKGEVDSPFDGGIGYGSSYDHSDMGNTLQALEALYYSRHLVKQDKAQDVPDLNWSAAIHFLQNCQNLPDYNKQSWASGDPKNKGGFVYYPGLSKAGTETNAVSGRVALRSYGSISYAGLLSYIYAQLDKEDPRVQAVLDWLRSNYTLEENPGMGPQGLFYYYHTMSKALRLAGVDSLDLTNGARVDWKRELAMRLINLQKPDGSWINDQHGRWWEKDPSLVTSYAILTLEHILRAG